MSLHQDKKTIPNLKEFTRKDEDYFSWQDSWDLFVLPMTLVLLPSILSWPQVYSMSCGLP